MEKLSKLIHSYDSLIVSHKIVSCRSNPLKRLGQKTEKIAKKVLYYAHYLAWSCNLGELHYGDSYNFGSARGEKQKDNTGAENFSLQS